MSKQFASTLMKLTLVLFLSACGTAARDASKLGNYNVGGVIKGLAGAGLELRNNVNGDSLILALPEASGEDVPFAFPKTLENGTNFDVVVHA